MQLYSIDLSIHKRSQVTETLVNDLTCDKSRSRKELHSAYAEGYGLTRDLIKACFILLLKLIALDMSNETHVYAKLIILNTAILRYFYYRARSKMFLC